MQQIDLKQLKFVMYLRKSSDSEDRQVASIPQQRKELTEIAAKEGLNIVTTLTESHSAFRPGRPKFNEMLTMIEDGKVNAVLAWHENRISRNHADSGVFQYMFDLGKLRVLRTKGNTFYDISADSFSLDINLAVAKKYSDDLSDAVLRGNRYKFFEKREWGGVAKPGYLNKFNPNTKTPYIDIDPERFPLIQKALELVIKKMYTPMQALFKLNNEWGIEADEVKG